MFMLRIEFCLSVPEMLKQLGGYSAGDKLDPQEVAIRQISIDVSQRMRKITANIGRLQRAGWDVYLQPNYFECCHPSIESLRDGAEALGKIGLDAISGMLVVWDEDDLHSIHIREFPACDEEWQPPD